LELRQYLDILKRHKWFIIEAVVVVALAAGILSNLRTPLYKATARILLTPNDPTQQLNPDSANAVAGNDADRYVAGQINIAMGEKVAAEAARALNVSPSVVEGKASVTQSGASNVLNVSVIDADPGLAREIADAVASGYIENRRLAAVSGLQGAAKDIEDRLGPLQMTIAQLDSQIGQASTVPGATSQLVSPIPPASASTVQSPTSPTGSLGGAGGVPSTQEALKAARYAAAVQYETLYSRQQELLVDISLKRGDAELIAEARTPSVPISPKPRRDAGLGALAGFVLAFGVIVLREKLDDKLHSAEELEHLIGLPLLAQLPYDEQAGDGLTIQHRPNTPLSEAMRSLRTSMQYQGVDTPLRTILVTSALPGEGKSLVAANLAASFAQAGYRTVLVSADLRRSSVEGFFGEVRTLTGLTGVLSPTPINGSTPGNGSGGGLARTVERRAVEALNVTSVDGLLLLPSGPTCPNPAELLGSKRMENILKQLSMNSDIIVVDTPPVLPVTDASILATKCDGVILVAALNESKRESISRAKAILDHNGARLLGVVANKARTSKRGYDTYGGYYGPPLPRASKRKRRTLMDSVSSSSSAS
jgi:polysaccharide biosynthesis transport protein